MVFTDSERVQHSEVKTLSYGSRAISEIETSCFASPPHDGFALFIRTSEQLLTVIILSKHLCYVNKQLLLFLFII